ncbi:MAG: class I SAM-dependent methyltransferase [Actinobacteria bacterium]|nr:class I SAM-dependent methyltransferase [Actinomycetota bacterium]
MPTPVPEPCRLCGGATTHAFTTRDHNRAIADEAYHYRRCADCGVLGLANVPEDLSRFYAEEYFALPTLEVMREKAVAERYRVDLVQRHVGGGRLIEIGPGDGLFTLNALDAGFDVTAIEMDRAAAEHLRSTTGIEVIESAAPHEALADLRPADVVVGWHVIEHLPQPWKMLDAAAAALRPGGVVVLAAPNPQSLGLRVLGRRWPHVDAPRHLFLLPPATIIERGRALGLEPAQLTATDPGGILLNRIAWRYALHKSGSRWWRMRLAHCAGDAMTALLAPVERAAMRGAAYTLVLRKP